MKLFDLSGRVAIITGTSRGIGRELAHGFAEAGAIVVGCARDLPRAEATAGELRTKGHETLAVAADVTRPEDCAALVDAAVARYGRLDILVCNAGVNVKKKAIDFSPAEFDTVINGNLRAYFLTAQAAARQFLKQGTPGAIVMNSSNASVAAFDELEEAHSRKRRVAFAMGARDDEDVLLVLEPARLVVGHIGQSRLDPVAAGGLRDAVRFVDPVSQRTLAIRPDLTAQIGRIAATRSIARNARRHRSSRPSVPTIWRNWPAAPASAATSCCNGWPPPFRKPSTG